MQNCNDYGNMFDDPEICSLLLDEVFLLNTNSWKAACLLCILIQDFAVARRHISRILAKTSTRTFSFFKNLKDYVAAAYVTELLSHLNAPNLTAQLFPKDLEVKLDSPVSANDESCTRFLSQFPSAPSVWHLCSFSIEGLVKSGQTICQLYTDFLLIMVDYNESISPLQLSLADLGNIQQTSRKITFHLKEIPQKTLLSLNIPKLTTVDLEFTTIELASQALEQLTQGSEKIVTSTPRKVSVVQDFISVTDNIFEEDQEKDGDPFCGGSDDPIYSWLQPPPPTENIRMPVATQSENFSHSYIPEDETLFGHAVTNTTKDTSASRPGRSINEVMTETSSKPTSDPSVVSKDSNLAFTKSSAVAEVPDSLDIALDEIDKTKLQQLVEAENTLSSSTKTAALAKKYKLKSTVKKPNAKAPTAKRREYEDVWSFEELEVSEECPSKTLKSKSLRLLNKSKPDLERKDSEPVKTKIQKKLENPEAIIPQLTKDLIGPSSEGHSIFQDTFSGLTSPVVSMHARAASRIASMVADEILAADLGSSSNAPSRKKRVSTDDADDSYRPSGNLNKKLKAASSSTNEKMVTGTMKRITRGAKSAKLEKVEEILEPKESAHVSSHDGKKLTEGKRVSLAQIFESAEGETEHTTAALGQTKKKAVPKKSTTKADNGRAKPKDTGYTSPLPEISQSLSQKPKDYGESLQKPVSMPLSSHRDLAPTDRPADHLPVPPVLLSKPDLHSASQLLSEAYTSTLQKQIYESINAFSAQLVTKIEIINDEINKKVMADLANKYENLFRELKGNFQKDVDEVCSFIHDVKGLLNLPEQELVKRLKEKHAGKFAHG